MLKRIITVICLLFTSYLLPAQAVETRSFKFMNIPSSARETGLGGLNVSISDEDINLVQNNPALTSDTLSGYVSFNYLSYFADVNTLSFVYQHDFERYGHWFIGANHFDYGSIQGFDETGSIQEKVEAGDTELYLGTSHRIRYFTLGASLKFINSSIGGFSSAALALDLGGVFRHPEQDFTAGLVFKNVGLVLSDYSESSNSKLPFDVQAGISFKPEHMPFRFSFTGYNLYKRDNSVADPDQPQRLKFFDQVFKHIVVGTELLLTKNVNLRLGYNHLVKQELKLEEVRGSAGFSYGLMFKVSAFEFAYSRGGYHVAGGSHNFMVTANTLFFRKGKKL